MTTENPTQQSRNEKLIEIYFKSEPFLGAIIGFGLAIGFAFTPVWPLAFLAGIISGLFYKKMWHGCLVGLGSVGIAWALYVIIAVTTTRITVLMDQLGQVIIGPTNLGWLLILIVIIVGLIIGALGGSLGSGTRKIINISRNNNKSE
ncbi:MAG: hypothetical protein ACTSO7_02940 [Candidatus Heimdallarchaeota archaeon]